MPEKFDIKNYDNTTPVTFSVIADAENCVPIDTKDGGQYLELRLAGFQDGYGRDVCLPMTIAACYAQSIEGSFDVGDRLELEGPVETYDFLRTGDTERTWAMAFNALAEDPNDPDAVPWMSVNAKTPLSNLALIPGVVKSCERQDRKSRWYYETDVVDPRDGHQYTVRVWSEAGNDLYRAYRDAKKEGEELAVVIEAALSARGWVDDNETEPERRQRWAPLLEVIGDGKVHVVTKDLLLPSTEEPAAEPVAETGPDAPQAQPTADARPKPTVVPVPDPVDDDIPF